ncbi:Acg family FMN-binding oxidoreductase [Jatrophihabitans sp.]|uniref:Acg family FMN-binding oxidoreductase n=1 Tax=Jatrophihabitans sp. TaxID=1932789 RepID=UPI002D10B62A|nr:nitroreductase family protein [Jatrophihabitans sp.]
MYPTARVATLGTPGSGIPTEALRRAAVRATWAPSVHNTQPWRFVIGHGVLEVHADFSRRLQVLDPTGRQLIISCGCAVFNARVSLAADGFTAEVRRQAPGAGSDLLAELAGSSERDPVVAALDPLLSLRRTNRRRFADDHVPSELLATLADAATREGARLFVVSDRSHRVATASLSRRAEAIEQSDPAYRAELRAWVTDDQQRSDGVPVSTLPRPVPSGAPCGTGEVPLRNYADPGDAGLPDVTSAGLDQSLLLLGTDTDDVLAWLQAGEALERVWLEVTRAGYAMSLFTQVIEVAGTRDSLRSELGLGMYPHVLLRVGRAPATPASRRRKLVEVLRHTAGAGDV